MKKKGKKKKLRKIEGKQSKKINRRKPTEE